MLRMTDLNQLILFKQNFAIISQQVRFSAYERDQVHAIHGELLDDFEAALSEDTPLTRYASRQGYRPIDLDVLSSILVSKEWGFSFETYMHYGLYPKRFDHLDLIREITKSPVLSVPVPELDLECERGEEYRFEFRTPKYDETTFVSEIAILTGILAAEGWTVEAHERIKLLGEQFLDRLRRGYDGPWDFEEALLLGITKANRARYMVGAYDDRYLRATVPERVFHSLVGSGVLDDDLTDLRLKREVDLFE
jgi:hypothetical protein